MVDKNGKEGLHPGEIPENEESGYAPTTEISRMSFEGEVPVGKYAYVEVMRPEEGREIIELDEGEISIGRSSPCEILLSLDNISRKHARIVFKNEEYCIEDLDSTNGVYVNGIKTVKCILRNQDVMDIGGVKLLFHE